MTNGESFLNGLSSISQPPLSGEKFWNNNTSKNETAERKHYE